MAAFNPAVRNDIAKKRRLTLPAQPEEDEYVGADDATVEDKTPYDSIANNPAPQEEMDSSVAPDMADYAAQEQRLGQQRSAQNESNFRTNLGRSLSHLTLGMNAPTSDADIYSGMDAQNKEASTQATGDMERRMKVMQALQANKSKSKLAEQMRLDRESKDSLAESWRQKNFDQRDRIAAEAKATSAADKAASKPVPASEAVAIGGANAALSALDDVSSTVSDNPNMFGPAVGMLDKAAAYTGVGEMGRNASTVNGILKQRAQIIGKYLEGGKLTNEDITRYEQSLPQFGDSPEVAQNKIRSLQRLIAQKQAAEKDALAQGGYNVGGIKTGDIRDIPKTSKGPAAGKTVIKVLKNKNTGQIKTIYSDGSEVLSGGN